MTDFGMSRIIPEKIQDIEKGVDVPSESEKATAKESKNGKANGLPPDDDSPPGDAAEGTNEGAEKKKVNFNEEANVSWERESIVNPDDATERHSNLLVLCSPRARCLPFLPHRLSPLLFSAVLCSSDDE